MSAPVGVGSLDVEDPFIVGCVLRQPGDNSCLYHSLSSGLGRCFPQVSFDATSLRCNINSYMSNHASSTIRVGPDISYSISEVTTEFFGDSLAHYTYNQSNSRSWGGAIEIATLHLMNPVNIYFFRPVPGSSVFQAFGTFESLLEGSDSNAIYLLNSGFNHYDSIFEVVYVDSSGISTSHSFPRGISSENYVYFLLGIFNGAKGSVVGFAFSTNASYQYSTEIFNMDGRIMEIPIVFVNVFSPAICPTGGLSIVRPVGQS